MVSRIGTYGQGMNNIRNNRSIMNDLNKVLLQSQTGKRSDIYLGISKQTKDLLSFEAEMSRANEHLLTINDTKSRLSEMDSSLGTIYDRVTDFRKQLVSASNDKNYTKFPIAQQARDLYDEIAQHLNKQYQGRFLFGGADVQNPPVRTFDETVVKMGELFTAAPVTVPPNAARSNFTDVQTGTNHPIPGVAGGGRLDTILAPPDTTSNTNGMPVRAMQIIDFFSNDQAYGSINGTMQAGSNLLTGAAETGTGYPAAVAGDGANGGTGTPPIIDPPLANNLQISNDVTTLDFGAIYYKGNEQTLTADVSDTANLEYGVTGSEQGFEQIMKALFILGSSDQGVNAQIDSVNLEDRVDASLQLLEDALTNTDAAKNGGDNLTNIRSHVGADMARLDAAKKDHINEITFLKDNIAEIEDVDVTEAAVMLQQHTTLLQASFSAFAKVSQLSLASFLR